MLADAHAAVRALMHPTALQARRGERAAAALVRAGQQVEPMAGQQQQVVVGQPPQQQGQGQQVQMQGQVQGEQGGGHASAGEGGGLQAWGAGGPSEEAVRALQEVAELARLRLEHDDTVRCAGAAAAHSPTTILGP